MDVTDWKARAYHPGIQYPATTQPLCRSCPAHGRFVTFGVARSGGRDVYTLCANEGERHQIYTSVPLQSQDYITPKSCPAGVSQRVSKPK